LGLTIEKDGPPTFLSPTPPISHSKPSELSVSCSSWRNRRYFSPTLGLAKPVENLILGPDPGSAVSELREDVSEDSEH
jgi:hypothetical protein